MTNHSESQKNKGSSSSSQSQGQSQMKGGQRIKETMSGSGPSGARPDRAGSEKESGGAHSHAGNTGFSSGQISPQAGSTGRTSMPQRSGRSSGKDR